MEPATTPGTNHAHSLRRRNADTGSRFRLAASQSSYSWCSGACHRTCRGSRPDRPSIAIAYKENSMSRPARLLVTHLILILACAGSASATPFFARAYGFKCQTCHSGFPRLNEFGLAFKANNFRIPGAERSAPMMWQKTIPLAVQVKPETINSAPGGVNQETDTQLLAGGLLSRTTAFYMHHTYFLD